MPVKSLKSLTLEGNPWHCDCKMYRMRTLQEEIQSRVYKGQIYGTYKDGMCATPPNFEEYGLTEYDMYKCYNEL